MATTAKTAGAAMRQRMFASTARAVASAAPTTDALRHATDALLRQQSQADQKLQLYSQKLAEAQQQARGRQEPSWAAPPRPGGHQPLAGAAPV